MPNRDKSTSQKGALRTLGRRLAELLSESDGVPAPLSDASEHGDSEPVRDGPAHTSKFLDRIRTALASDKELVAGRVNFIDLDRVQARLGARWPRVAARADEIARRSIEQRISPADVYTALPGMRYLISFSELSPDEAKIRCAMIGREIALKLLGENLGDDVPVVRTAVASIDGDLAFELVPDLGTMAEALYVKVSGPDSETAAPESDVPIEEMLQEDPLQGVNLVYRPMWDVTRDVVSTYTLVPALRKSGGRLLVGAGSIFNIDNPSIRFDLDIMTMRQALHDLVELRSNERRYLLSVPVHFESVATTRRRNEYLQLCRGLPSDLSNLMLFELIGVPLGIPQSRILELTTMLKRHCRALLMRLPLDGGRFRPAAETGVNVVGVDLSESRLPERQTIRAFDRFCEAAQKTGLQTYVHGIRTMSLATSAVAAGFSYIDGDTVVSITDEPGGLYRFNSRNLIRNWKPRGDRRR